MQLFGNGQGLVRNQSVGTVTLNRVLLQYLSDIERIEWSAPGFFICAKPGLQIGQPAFSSKPEELGVRSHAGLGLYEIVIILDSLHAEIEI
jgi:hypothetical protein